jgi:hypothetical protein
MRLIYEVVPEVETHKTNITHDAHSCIADKYKEVAPKEVSGVVLRVHVGL